MVSATTVVPGRDLKGSTGGGRDMGDPEHLGHRGLGRSSRWAEQKAIPAVGIHPCMGLWVGFAGSLSVSKCHIA